MAETLTANYSWTKPDPGASPNTWGATLNADLDKIDAQVFANQQAIAAAAAPIGSITMFAGATPPANWLLCDGSTLDYGATPAYQGLFNVIGHTFNTALTGTQFALPNLTQKFPLGVGPNALGATGGSLTATIAVANLPSHSHTITEPSGGHVHSASQPPHTHADSGHTHPATATETAHSHSYSTPSPGVNFAAGTSFSAGGGAGTTSSAQPAVTVTVGSGNAALQTAQPGITINPALTGITATNATGSGTPLNTYPPFLALNFIIRYQ